MRGLAITSKGIEDIACLEINEILAVNCEVKDGYVIFEIDDIKDLCKLSYKSQSVDKVVLLLENFKFEMPADIINKVREIKFPEWLKGKSFSVKCKRIGQHEFSSVDIEKELSESIEKALNLKLDFKNPEIIFYSYINLNDFYFGIDFSGFELQKRKYKIYSQSNSLRGTIAYALVRLSGYGRNGILLDPFVGDGTIAIEAVLYSIGLSPNYYNKDKFAFVRFDLSAKNFLDKQDKKTGLNAEIIGYDSMFKFVDYSRKNAKIAGVHDFIKLSRVELEWLDVKFKEKSIDRIVTKLPSSIKQSNDKLLNELFYQAEFVLKENGSVAIITYYPTAVKQCSLKRNFRVKEERMVWSGKQELWILVLKKGM